MIQIYIQTLRISAPELGHSKIDLNINEEQIIWIVSLLSSATQEREQQTKVLTQLLVLLLCPPHPFVNRQIDVYDFTLKHLIANEEESNELITQKEYLASIFSATQQKLALHILKKEIKLEAILTIGRQQQQNKDSLLNCLRFWYNVSQDNQVKEELIKRKLPIEIYKNLREENPGQVNRIVKLDSQQIGEQELFLTIELIKSIISGCKQLETELAELLKQDLDHLSKIRDMNFVNKVFLSLLKEEKCVPVCIWPYDSDSKRWVPHYKPLFLKDTSNNQNSNSANNSFLPSTLLQGESRSVFIKNFKDIIGNQAKGTLKKLTSSNWVLAHQQTESGTVSQFAGVWKNIENKAPAIILVQSNTNGGGSTSIFGCYCAKGIPQMPPNLAQDCDYPVTSSPEDFVFCYVDDQSFYHFKPKAGVSILSMFTDYEGGGAISIANDFILVSYSYDFVFTVGVQYEIDKIQEQLNPVPAKPIPDQNQTFVKLEVWTLGAQSQQPQLQQQQMAQAPAQKKVKFADQVPGSQIDSEGSSILLDFKHPWFNENSPFKNYRTNPVFMVPAHLSLTDLSKILLQSNVTFKPRFNSSLNSPKETISDLYSKFLQEVPLVEIFNSIVDLEYETNQLINMDLEEGIKEKEEDNQGSDSSQGQISGYVPKMGLFESFEAQDGVKKIISVTLSSLDMWKQDQQAKSWSLWLKELESFSQLPLFFQIFLKNTKCKDLLFKVLAGQPDNEISAEPSKAEVKTKWEEEQKNAVQFNYKILSEVFQISNDTKLRNIALSCGLLPRILERLGSISGEKSRTYDESEEVIQEIKQSSSSPQKEVKNTEKKFRKGVGYSKNVGEIFNVAVYLENKKLRNEQIKNLIDICTNFFSSKEWKANEEVLDVIMESPLLPILESAFRNGSWLDMAKEKLTRAIVSQKKLVPCLIEIDKKYKPVQSEPIYKLLSKLNDLAEIFINCLSQQEKSEQEKNQMNPLLITPSPQLIDQILEENLPLPVPQLFKQSSYSSFDSEASLKEEKKKQFIGIDPFATSLIQKELPKSIMKYQYPQLNLKGEEEESKSEEKKESFSDQIFNALLKEEELKKNSLLQIIKDSIQKKTKDEKLEESNSLKDSSDSSEEEEKKVDYNDLVIASHKNKGNDKKVLEEESEEDDDEDEESEGSWESEGGTKYDILKEKGVQKLVKKEVKEDKSQDDESSEYVTVSDEEEDNSQDDNQKQKHPSKLKLGMDPKKKLSMSSEEVESQLSQKQIKKMKALPSIPKLHKKGQKSEKQPSEDENYKEEYSEFNSSEEEEDSPSSSSNADTKEGKKIDKKVESSDSSSSYDSEEQEEGEENEAASNEEDTSSYDTESEETLNSQQENNQKYNEMQFSHSPNHFFIKPVSFKSLLRDSEIPERLAKDVIKTYRVVMNAVEKLKKNQGKSIFNGNLIIEDENFLENALSLPLFQSYRLLLQDLRFAYMDMKDPNDMTGQHFKHHYQSIAVQNQNPPPSKMVRLAQELADLSNALPSDHTNAIFVRVDQSRVDMMKALVCGASNTPYAHGCYEFDIFCDNNYPREPPKMNLITTGNGSVRFNPNLYACGKVCLSLLGTWRGQATENWDPKLSTILQVLLSTQAIIMSEEVYFNEPGFENEAGTPEGEKKNEGYQNIVRYCNIKFAMVDQIKKPSKGFETVIKRHFYLKREEILQEVHHWVELAEKNEAAYAGLVNDHNYNWANQFKASKTKYKEMLQQAVKQLEEEINKLERPNEQDLKLQQKNKKRVQSKKAKTQDIKQGGADLEEISVGSDDEEEQINTESKEIDIKDEKVQDRWSRYIGAMGAEAVAKQAAAKIFLSGAGALGIEIAKNIVLAGCKQFTLHDYQPISYRDLAGQFFLNLEEDILNQQKKKATRGEACLHRLRQLNYYVKCTLAEATPIPLDEDSVMKAPWNLQDFDVIILTEASVEEIVFINKFCRKNGKKFISTDCYGPFGRIFNDFGEQFEVLDKNGEELQDVMIKNISNEEKGIVELLPSNKHKFEDGDEVLFTKVEGMELLPGMKHEDEQVKSESINQTIHKVQVITPYSFKIGDTTRYGKYKINGIAKQLKTKKMMTFKTFEECMTKGSGELLLDGNLSIADFEKMGNNVLSHVAFEALDQFRSKEKRYPGVWNLDDANKFVELCKEIGKRYDIKPEDVNQESNEMKFYCLFSFSCQGTLNPLCAYLGGFVSQECVKAITQKFSPIGQVFYYDAFEILPDFDPKVHLTGGENEQNKEAFFEEKYVKEIVKTREQKNRYDGLRIVVGQDIIETLNYTKLFMVGAGAIGCELLKNYAMIGVGVGKANAQLKKKSPGQIVLTDPDVIEVSNLNRQFLFREKHLRKPKSQTAATAAIYMNSELRENIVARLDKVHEGTNHIFTDSFFESINVVTNALDNVHARRYIDARCVTAKTPLLESGTLGPKGHVQVVLPYKTESYGSMNDPEDNNEIPHCTLKMFPEETLHCVEWARDKFGKLFSQGPKNTLKILEEGGSFQPVSQQDVISLKECVRILQKRPKNFDQCVEYARLKFEKYFNHDIRQLLHVYPLDAKTKEGNPFWALPKRPPSHIDFDKENILHCYFVASFACLRATLFKIPIPSDKPRSEDFRRQVGVLASKIQVPQFVPNDEKAKEIQASVSKADKSKEEEKKEEEKQQEEEQKIDPNDTEKLMSVLKSIVKDLEGSGIKNYNKQLITPEEFEKDNDANYHIDLIYSMANCRSSNYKLDPMDWITVKLKAGRIVPALATTTASIAGLQTLELIKLIKQCKKTDHRNIFLNLAVPMMQASEPGDVMKQKLCEGLEVTLWDRWEVKLGKDVRLLQVMGYIEQQFQGLLVKDVMRGNTPIYFHAIMGAAGKEKEKEKVLNTKVSELVSADSDDKYVDLNITCTKKGEDEDKILSGVPPVRVYFE